MFPFNKLSGLYKSSAVVSAWTLLSRLMGFIRDILFASILGTGPIADAFLVAFRIPNLFRRFFAEGAFSAAFIPILAKEYEKYGIQGGILFTSKIASFLLVFILPLIIFPLFPIGNWPDMYKSFPTTLYATYAPTGSGASGIVILYFFK